MLSLLRRRPVRSDGLLARRHADPFFAFGEEMESVFDRFLEGWRVPEEWVEMREWEVNETDKEVVMRLELPGFEAAEINLTIEGNEFVVRAEHPEKKEETPERHPMHRYEYRFMMPTGTDPEHIEATYRNGVLELHLPRLPEAQPRRVELKT